MVRYDLRSWLKQFLPFVLIKRLVTLTLFLAKSWLAIANDRPMLYEPQNGFGPKNIAIVVNDTDPISGLIGRYYQQRRNIPAENLIHVRFPAGGANLSPLLFQQIKQRLDRETPKVVQAYVLTWTSPFRVGCMSITSAFAAGYNSAFCAPDCGQTRVNPYYGSASQRPFDDFGWRPTMMLAGRNYREVLALIERGVASDSTFPQGTAYLVQTPDAVRNSRAHGFDSIQKYYQGLWPVQVVKIPAIANKYDILFYFTGLEMVPHLLTNRFLPGAIADHLTSKGGQLTGSKQMSSLRWLEAGATGSYGTVVEPCNYPQKFPSPAIVITNYLRGSTLIEAYWKSVAWPGQGVFIGEPLAKPFARRNVFGRDTN